MSVLEGEVVDEQPGQALVVRQPVELSVTPAVKATELTARLDVIREAMHSAMKPDVDYGVIPGAGTKPALLKPGAEKLGVLFQLDVQLENEKERDGAHLTVTSRATVFHAPTGARLGYGEGMCSTYEKKYRYRQAQRVCPACGVAAIIKGKAEYGGGWVCFKKRDGCGAKYPDGDKQIESQQAGQVENPDLPDLWNTVLKMAEKRARVDAILAVTGASALFTQDVEDEPRGEQDLPFALQPDVNYMPKVATDEQVAEVEALIAELHESGVLPEPEAREGMVAAYKTSVTGELTEAQAYNLAGRLRAKKGTTS